MGRHIVLISLLIVFIINYCVCELSVEKKQKIYNGFVSYLKNLPDQPYYLHNGILKNIVETSENGYSIEVDFRGEDTDAQDLKFVKCYGTVYDKQESGVEVANGYQCHVESDTSTPADSIEEVVTEWLTTEPPELHQPIKLDNEVQTEPVTSGEQFIAVPRDGQPCIGCASQVNPEAAGVTDLALLGIRQLDQLEPSVIHSLNKVIMVERQVQVVNGVRYILTILIDYNSCSQNVAEECVVTKTCKVSVLDKPWAKLPDGSRYRVVVANNCTADWIFEEIGETRDSERDKPQNPQLPTPHYGEVPNIGTFEDIIHSVRNPDVQSQPEIEKSLTDEEIRNIQQQIIPNSQFSQQSLEKQQLETNNVHGNDLRAHQVVNTESQSSFVHSNPTNNLGKISHGRNGISDEKKKVIDDLLNFFDYAGFKQKNDGDKEASRMKRSFEKELHTFDLAENFNKMRKNIDSAKHIYALAQSMVDYLNEMDMSIKNRLLSSVISAEEESENNHRYFYVQARIIIPCDKVECNNKDEQIKICNGVIDGTNERSPQVMNTFCHNEKGKKNNIGKNNIVPPGDPILSKLAYTALKTIELESQEDNALYIIKIHNANTQKLSGTLTKIAILLGHTNCSKSVGLYKRKNCTKVEKMGTKLCDVEILEKGKEKKISYICTDRPVGESFVNKKLKYGIDDPDVDEILEEALQYLEIQSNKNNKQRVVDVKSVSTRLVGGLLTNIEFLVGYTKCTNNNDIGRDYCEFLKNETFRNCEAQIWQRPWLEDERQMKVLCEDDISNPVTENGNDFRIRKRRQVASQPLFGGLTKQDKNDPRYKAMAEESLQKYLQTSGATGPHRVVTIDNVKSQVVAGSLTTIDFTVLANNADVIKCHSKIWEQPWINKKEIDVTCALANEQNRGKRQVPGGEKQQDKNDPRYKAMAEESLQKYLQTSGATGPHRVVTIDNVKSQVVAGSLTTIDFTVLANNADVIKCHSKIWEQPWINKKEIDVTCALANEQNREKRQVPGGEKQQDKNDPRYKAMAEESLQKYLQTSGATGPHRVVTIDNVKSQVVAGSLTTIDFTVLANNADVIKCHSKIWEQPWINKKEIDVTCALANEQNRGKRQVPGGEKQQDKNDPRYKAMAEESLQKYLQTSGATGPHRVVTIDNVKSQVVAGSLTTIDFTVLANNADVIKCHSKIWVQPWINKKQIDVTCALANEQNRGKRQVPGGEKQQDKNDPRYKAMAEECLQKYLQTSGATGPHRIVTIDNVKSQVVVGSLTTIDFTVLANNADVIKCHSKIWEQPWINKKEIDVTCANEQNRVKRQLHEEISGGFFLQDPQSPEYTKLAEKSLLIFLNTSNVMQHYKVTKVTKVQTQVVSGFITKLVFLVSPTNCQITEDGKMSASSCDIQDSTVVKKCNSKVWDKPWRSSTVYSVKCFLNEDRQRREILRKRFKTSNYKMSSAHSKVGSTVEQDPSKNEYKILADESLRKYQLLQKSNIRQKILQVKRVETQVVSGTIYKIEYTAVPTTCSANVIDTSSCDRTDDKVILYCHTEIWDRPWLKRKNIDVSCIANKLDEDEKDAIISKRSVLGGPTSKDVDNELYKKMAKTALEKYQKLTKTEYLHKVLTITHVSEKVIQGFLTTIKFTISPTTCLLKSATDEEEDCPFQQPIAKLMCVAEIRERPVLDLTDEDITVTCHRKKHKNIKQISKRISKYDRNHDTREKRQTRTDENEIGDDAKYVYAHHAIKNINQRSDTDNLQKLITIYDVVTTYQMETPMVSMYIETAYTYCLKQNKDIDLNSCDELDGMNHRICFVRVFPSADDDLVVLKVVTVCDDEPNFVSVTHLSVPDLLTISLVALENSPDIGYKLVHRGEPYVVPSLHSHIPVKLSFIVASTNCSKYVKVATDVNVRCFVDTTIPDKECHANIWMMPVTKKILHISANCSRPHLTRTKRTLTSENTTANIQDMVDQSLEKLEMSSLHRYKQRVIKINSYSTKLTSGRVTTIDFDVGYTNCLKYEWVDDASTCQFIEHLPRRHCVSEVWERLWLKNGRKIEVTCQDDETPLEAHVEFESADIATRLAQQALKHIEAKYPHPKKQQLVRIFSLEKQVVAGIHYRMKIEVGLTDCLALSVQDNCHLINDGTPNRFCRVNVWLRPWTDHPPNFRVTCDYQAGAMTDMYHHVQAEQLFFNFITTYKPEYINDHVEMTKRFEIFKENVKKIHELNTHERGTGVYAVTRFTDLTYEEFKSKYLGLNPNLKKPNQIPMRQAEIPKVHQLPASFDWRPLGAVTEVKDQGACGSCWAFSVTGNIEGQWKLKTGKLLSLSEQELVDCDKMDDGCDGGYMDNAYRAIEQLGGLETEEEYPYEAEDDKCSFNKSLSKVQISGAVNISSNETNMAKWLVHNGPISIGINANAMQFYVGGVSHPWKALCNPKNIDHGVLIVGYGIKEYPLFNKQLPYWVVKNSWGPGWGEQGYYRVFRGDGTCGVNTMASSAVV
ncbi:unnamed protein product [Chilo suppressalis]|uniref:Cysteine proteinase inhibitor n=1 Tax=Chilo suppressalis TaxID=168631 RepID=A0ABN8L6S9_CHISP|nr:unnamed protein product [Chilo suppressalis]